MKENNNEKNMLIGFLSLCETSAKDGYIGSILVTDQQGVPQEFRCTHPVKPTTIQKPLYGDTLEPYIGVNLCGKPLIKTIQNKLILLIVQKEFLLDVRIETPYPVVFLRKAGEMIDIKPFENSEKTLKIEKIECSTGRFQPIIISPHSDFNEDISPSRETLEEIFCNFDPIEPFGRMAKAIELLGKQDNRFQ